MCKGTKRSLKKSSILVVAFIMLLAAGTLVLVSCSSGVDISEADRVLTSFGLAWPASFAYTCLSAVPVNVTVSALDQNGAVMSWDGVVDILATNADVTVDPDSVEIAAGTVSVSLVFDTTGTTDQDTTVKIRYGNTVTEIPGTLTVQKVLDVYQLTVTNDGYGTTDPSGTIEVTHGVATNITATPSELFALENVFEEWTIPSGSGAAFGNSDAASTTVTLTGGDATVRANFDQTDAVFPSFTVQAGNRLATLQWDDVPLAESYDLFYTADESTPSDSNGTRVTDVTSPHEVEGLDNGVLYTFRIRAESAEGTRDWSGNRTAIPLSATALAPRVEVGYRELSLVWKELPGTSEYVVERATSKVGSYSTVATSADITVDGRFYTYTDSGLQKGQGYFYRVSPDMDGSVRSAPVFGEPSPFPDGGARLVASCQTHADGNYSYSHDVAVSGDYAYVADGQTGNPTEPGLKVVYIGDPESVDDDSVVGSCSLTAPRGVAVSGNFAYVAALNEDLVVIDISDPENVTDDSYDVELTCNFTGTAYDVVVDGDYAYVAADTGGLQIVDINPASGTYLDVVGSCATTNAYGVAVSGNYAYVADLSGGLKVINIATPTEVTNDSVVGICEQPTNAQKVAVKNNYAYVTNSNSGLTIVNVTDAWADNPSTPLETYYTCDTYQARDITINGYLAYVADYLEGIKIIDITNPAESSVKGSLDTSAAVGIAVSGGYAYVADSSSNLKIMDVQSPANATGASVVATCPTTQGNGVTVYGDYAYIADGAGGLQIIDISSPSEVDESSVVGTCAWDLPYTPDAKDVLVLGDYAYVADRNSGVVIIDISDPESVTNDSFITTCKTGNVENNYAYDIVIQGDYAFVSDYGVELAIVDVSDPESVTDGSLVATCETETGYGTRLSLEGDYAFVGRAFGGIVAVDVSDPESVDPFESVEEECTDVYVYDIVTRGSWAFVPDGGDGLAVVDISNPLSPMSQVANCTTSHDVNNAYRVFLSGNWAIVANPQATGTTAGLAFIDVSNPALLTDASRVGLYPLTWASANPRDVAVRGRYAYIADYDNGLKVIELSPEE